MEFPLAPLDRTNRIGTVFLTILPIIILGTALVFVPAPDCWFVAGIALLLVVILVATAGFSPAAIRIAPEGLVIVRRLLPALVFPWSDFTAARVERGHWASGVFGLVKVCGSAGFLGYFGWFRLKGIGSIRCYATRRDSGIILTGRRAVVVTPEDLDGAARAIATFLPVESHPDNI
jgi:hypothetical protein